MTNRNIDFSIFTQKWMIEQDWGLQQLLKYHDDLSMAETHGLASLRYDEMRASLAPKVFSGAELFTGKLKEFSGSGAIAVLNLDGAMRVEDGMCSYGIDSLVEDLNTVYNNPGIIGAVLKINSGGGSTIAAGLLRSALTNTPKPVVGLAYLMASGALYGTLPLKNVLATDPLALIGSIGVVYQVNKKVATWYKENVDDIYATKSFEKNDAWNAYLKGDRTIFEKDADQMASIFANAVAQDRELSEEQKKTALNGKLFTADVAKQLNLISGFGNMSDAMRLVTELVTQQKEQNSPSMSITSKFIAQIARFVPGVTLKEGASMEEVETALANAPDATSYASMQEQIGNLTTDLQNANATITAQVTSIEGLTANVASLSSRFDAFAKQAEGFATAESVSQIASSASAANTAVAKVIAQTTETPKAANLGVNPTGAIDKFTAQIESSDVAGESKY